MSNLIQEYLNQKTIQIPSIVGISTVGGYLVCGAPCAAAGVVVGATDVALKYSGYFESYPLTFGSLGAFQSYKTIKPIIDNYNLVYGSNNNPGATNTPPLPEGSAPTINISYFKPLVPAIGAAIGMLFGKLYAYLEEKVAEYFYAPPTESVKTIYVDKIIEHEKEIEKTVFVDKPVDVPCSLVPEHHHHHHDAF